MATAERIRVEVVAALRSKQAIVRLAVPAGATAADAVSAAALDDTFPDIDIGQSRLAVWGQPVERDQPLRSGDRVEVLRPLTIDPRDARRELAKSGKSMGAADPQE
jgi:putative ubiquitin-RnfH superfamily antitoxin RatB of RatAB toxin-antitoxin module